MAKGKRAVALFEVIQSSRASRNNVSLSTPQWWFKRRSASGGPPEPAQGATAIAPADPNSTAPAPRAPGIDLRVDPDRQRINFNMSYTTALVSAFTVVVVLGLAIVIGKHMTRGPAAAMADTTTEQLRQGPAQPAVLNVAQSGATTKKPAPIKVIAAETSKEAPATPPAQSAAAVSSQPGKRILGLNYVIAQSYPEEQMAISACDVLNKSGIPCTVERHVNGYQEFAVVGLTGFERPNSDPQYKVYEASIRAVSDKNYKTSKFMRLDPHPKKWDKGP